MQVFSLPQLLVVPLFQRPYVWKQDEQWEPLWADIRRLARLQLVPTGTHPTHFLGAVVIQASQQQHGSLQRGEIVDGQQRLTTLQLLLDAAAAVFEELDLPDLAAQLGQLTHNPQHFVTDGLSLKVRHLNRDAATFRAVMEGAAGSGQAETLIGAAHAYFAEAVTEWLQEGDLGVDQEARHRAQALVQALCFGVQLVVIDLQPEENSQEIFETLNARGTPLTAADLIKNLVFQRLAIEGADVEEAYRALWPFEEAFWEASVSVGRYPISRGSLFLGQWLVARLHEEISPRATFTRFKHYVEHETRATMAELLAEIKLEAAEYRRWHESAGDLHQQLDAPSMCVYRSAALQSEALKPLLIWLHDPRHNVHAGDRDAVIRWVESWVMRRAILRLASDTGRSMALLLHSLDAANGRSLDEVAREFLCGLTTNSSYWPADQELRLWFSTANAYRRYRRGILRMFLEAAEDDARGFSDPSRPSRTGTRVSRLGFPIEHILPQRWATHWPVEGPVQRIERDERVHRLGNLTLLTESLNSSISNGGWETKRPALARHDVMLISRELKDLPTWDEACIDARTHELTERLIRTWPVPEGHRGVEGVRDRGEADGNGVSLRALVAEGLVPEGSELRGRGGYATARATVLLDGSLQMGDQTYSSPSGAARVARDGRGVNGWWFWVLPDGRSLRDIWRHQRQLDPEAGFSQD